MPELKLSPEQERYLAAEEWVRAASKRLRARLGDDALIQLTCLMLEERRALGLPTRLRAIAGRRFPQGEAEIESTFLDPVPEGCGACLTEGEDY